MCHRELWTERRTYGLLQYCGNQLQRVLGAVKFCRSGALEAMQASMAPLDGIEMARPDVESFPIGGATMRSYARHKPSFRIPRAFPTNAMNASDMGESPFLTEDTELSETFSQTVPHEFPCLHGRAYDPLAYSYTDGSAFKKGIGTGTCNQARSESIRTVMAQAL